MYTKYSSPNSLLLYKLFIVKGYKTSALIPDLILSKYKKQASERTERLREHTLSLILMNSIIFLYILPI